MCCFLTVLSPLVISSRCLTRCENTLGLRGLVRGFRFEGFGSEVHEPLRGSFGGGLLFLYGHSG